MAKKPDPTEYQLPPSEQIWTLLNTMPDSDGWRIIAEQADSQTLQTAIVEAHGKTYVEVARQLGTTRHELNQLLSGRSAGRNGIRYRVAVGLRLKPTPSSGEYAYALPNPNTVRRWLADNHIEPKPHPRTQKR